MAVKKQKIILLDFDDTLSNTDQKTWIEAWNNFFEDEQVRKKVDSETLIKFRKNIHEITKIDPLQTMKNISTDQTQQIEFFHLLKKSYYLPLIPTFLNYDYTLKDAVDHSLSFMNEHFHVIIVSNARKSDDGNFKDNIDIKIDILKDEFWKKHKKHIEFPVIGFAQKPNSAKVVEYFEKTNINKDNDIIVIGDSIKSDYGLFCNLKTEGYNVRKMILFDPNMTENENELDFSLQRVKNHQELFLFLKNYCL